MWKVFLVIRILILKSPSRLSLSSLKTTWWWKESVGNNSFSSTKIILQWNQLCSWSDDSRQPRLLCLGWQFLLTIFRHVCTVCPGHGLGTLSTFLFRVSNHVNCPISPASPVLSILCPDSNRNRPPYTYQYACIEFSGKCVSYSLDGLVKHKHLFDAHLMVSFEIWTL